MLRSLKDLAKYRVAALDGDLKSVHDFYFDDREWSVRYLVVDTGNWLPGRKVLISPVAVNAAQWEDHRISLNLTKDKIKNSPETALDKPVSRQHEEDLVRHYDWPVYWGALPGSVMAPPLFPQAEETRKAAEARGEGRDREEGDPNLRSMKEVLGYAIEAGDGDIGHVEDFIVSDEDWMIRYMVVDTKNWLPGRKVLVIPDMVGSVDWETSQVNVELTREQIKSAPEFDPAAPVNRQYEARFYDFYGRPKYWL